MPPGAWVRGPDGIRKELDVGSVARKPTCWVCGCPAADPWTYEVPTCSPDCAAYFAYLVIEGLLVAA